MSEPRKLPRIGGLPLHPLADAALPLLVLLTVALTVGLVAGAIDGWTARPVLPGMTAGLVAFLVAAESHLFTTLFAVRDFDAPRALRWLEMMAMAVAIKAVATQPIADRPLDLLLRGADDPGVWAGVGLLAYAWWQGRRLAELMGPLHPYWARGVGGVPIIAAEGGGAAAADTPPDGPADPAHGASPRAGGPAATGATAPAPGPRPRQEVLMHDDHGEAFAALRAALLSQVAGVALLMALGRVVGGGPDRAGAALLLLLLALTATLVAARLRQEITWTLEQVTPPPAVTAAWIPRGLALLAVPAVLALLLPAGPRLPVERLAAWLNRPGLEAPPPRLEPPELPPADAGLPPAMEELQAYPWAEQIGSILAMIGKAVGIALGIALAAWLLGRAARELADRVGRKELRGLWAVLALLARWYLSLLALVREWLGTAVREAVAVPARTLAAALSESGAIGRYLPALTRPPADPRGAVRYYFRRLQREAARRGLRRRPSTTAAELARQVAGAVPERAAEATELAALYERARYSPLPVGPEQASLARRAWAALVRAIRTRRIPARDNR